MNKLEKELLNVLESKKAFGESRHLAKQNRTDQEKIFSYNTMNQYKRIATDFANFVNEKNPKARHKNQAKKYVNDYLESLQEKNYSAWTIQNYNAGLTKIFGENLCSIELKKRNRETIRRSRDSENTKYYKHFSETLNSELINFCKKTGLRRSELEKLRANQLHQDQNGNYYLEIKGKGGKIRHAYILENDSAVIERIRSKQPNELVWKKVHDACPVHTYRADYALSYYLKIRRDESELDKKEKYHCRKDMLGLTLDKKAMLEVSKTLGHNRIDVIAEHYLYKLK